jgi:hypothetical protein
MRKSVFFILFLTCSSLFAQSDCDITKASKPIDSLTPAQFEKIIFTQFSRLLNGDNKTNIGNFASLDINQAKADFNGIFVNKKRQLILSVNLNGAIDGGVIGLFSENKINPNVGASVKVNKLFKNFHINTTVCQSLERQNDIEAIEKAYNYQVG